MLGHGDSTPLLCAWLRADVAIRSGGSSNRQSSGIGDVCQALQQSNAVDDLRRLASAFINHYKPLVASLSS